MIIGLDFDNTIVCYDEAIEQLATEVPSLPPTTPKTKLGIRDYLREQDRETEWTEFQGKLYGPGMVHARPFPAALEIIGAMQNAGHTTVIVSHRSKHPYLGPKYDLHDSARQWIKKNLVIEGNALISEHDIHLNETKDAKVELIASLQCDVFIDDLVDILTHVSFPPSTEKLWFSPGALPHKHDLPQNIRMIKHWNELTWLSNT